MKGLPKILAGAALCALVFSAGFAAAQPAYPSRPIKLVVPYPPGALTDLLARAIGERLGAALKQPLIIENKPGAGTLVGTEFVAKQAAALTDLLTGELQVMFSDATVAVPNIQAGKVVALGTSAAKPTALVPNVPSIAATVPGFDWQAWQGIVAPSSTPKKLVARLSAELQKIQAMPEFREQLVKFGMDPFPPQSPEQFAAMIAAEQPRWAKAVRDSGAKVD